ncbi:MAG: hypothetical protein K0A94_12490 [Desulfuromonadales bacterium]|nr:hypothetical protein [Desulfuromonadales bacterium]
MNTPHQSNKANEHHLKNFVHELNVFRRQIALYPQTHPKTLAGANKILAELANLTEFGDKISLGIAPDHLVVNGSLLDPDNPSCRDLGGFFSKLDIAVVSFHQGLSTVELIGFLQLLSARTYGHHSTPLNNVLKNHQISHVSLTQVDYDSFTSLAPDNSAPTASATAIWHDFIEDMMSANQGADLPLDTPGADQLAQLLNSNSLPEKDCTAMISKLVDCLLEQCQRSATEITERLCDFSKKLNPKIRQQLYEGTLRALDQQPQAAQKIIPNLSAEFINDALFSHSSKNHKLSQRLTDLLGAFALNKTESVSGRVVQSNSSTPPEPLQANIELLFLEDQHDEYLPASYQLALQKILAGEVQGSLAEDLAEEYRNSLAEQRIEHQCCEIIFDLLAKDIDTGTEEIMQYNLVDLSQFFLDTGDFQALRKTLSRWMSYVNSSRSQTNLLTEKMYGAQLKRSFLEEVLNSVPIWCAEKFTDICEYLSEVGEHYAPLLIERLGNETDTELRKIWMQLLLELGAHARPAMLEALDDHRWFLVRNLLLVLGQQKGGIPPKTVLNLCRHRHPKVRREALRILFRINPSAANRLLEKELTDADQETMKIMIPLTEMSNNDHIFNQLNRLLEVEPLTADNLEIKLHILTSLSSTPQPACLMTLTRLLIRKEFFLNSLRKTLKTAAAETLRRYPHGQLAAIKGKLEGNQSAVISNILSSTPSSFSGQSL